jgi:dTDP-4-amino-4,6-dideoxygalactose transaminase
VNAVPLMDLVGVHQPMLSDLHGALDRVLASSAFTGGAEVESFEAELADLVGVGHAIGVGSGTAALHLALVAAGIGPQDEVILPPNTFFATAEAVVSAGAVPVLADVDPDTALLDVDAAAAAVTARTAAVIPVHLYGQPVDGDRFADLADRFGLFLLEDACQAIGAAWGETPAGGLGDAAAFSFYPGKNLGALGDGGAVTTDDADLARRIRLLRSHGESQKNQHVEWAMCERLDGLQAAFLRVKLAHLARQQKDRDAAVRRYREGLSRLPGVQLLSTAPGARHAHHLMVVRVRDRDRVISRLHGAGIAAGVHYPMPIHLQPAANGLGKPGRFPVAEELASSVISLPLWPGMTVDTVDRVVDALAAALLVAAG